VFNPLRAPFRSFEGFLVGKHNLFEKICMRWTELRVMRVAGSEMTAPKLSTPICILLLLDTFSFLWDSGAGGIQPPICCVKRQKIADTPVVGDLAVLNAHDIDRLEMDLSVRWSHPKKRPFMRAVICLVGCHSIAVDELPVDLCMKVTPEARYSSRRPEPCRAQPGCER
jgi:hypothetical protein